MRRGIVGKSTVTEDIVTATVADHTPTRTMVFSTDCLASRAAQLKSAIRMTKLFLKAGRLAGNAIDRFAAPARIRAGLFYK